MMEAFWIVLLGMLARFGIPVLLTVSAVYFLRKLDERWQKDSEDLILEAASLVPPIQCWLLRDCPKTRMEQCPAYKEGGKPCWQFFRDQQGQLREDCIDCDVFRDAPALTQA
jgi:hypothetical protein